MTKSGNDDIIIKLSDERKSGKTGDTARGALREDGRPRKRILKKSSKNLLTNERKCGKINILSSKRGSDHNEKFFEKT